MFASVSQSASKGGALAGYETVLGVREGFPLRQEFLKRRGGGRERGTSFTTAFAGSGTRGNTNTWVFSSQQSRCSLALEANESSIMNI